MRMPWMRLAWGAAVWLAATSAWAQPLNLTNHTTRPIMLLTEDHPCTNTTQGASAAPAPGCLIFANDPAAVYTDPSNDYFGQLSFVGTSGLGTSTFLITVSKAVWQKALTITLQSSGVILSTNTDFEILFDSGSGSVGPNPSSAAAPNYWSATASFSGVPLTLVGAPDPSDYPFFGTPNNPMPPPTLGPPLVLSCGWAKTNDPNSPPSGTPSTPLGPGYPGAGICLAAIAQPGFALSGTLANTAMTFFSDTTIQATGGTGALADAVWTAFKWQLNETVDTDGDTIPDSFDNCPYTPNTDQKDSGGVGVSSAPDGIGDACQCGDVNNDGIVNGNDATLLSRAAVSLAPFTAGVTALPGFAKCDVNANGTCDGTDATIISRASVGLAPAIKQGCTAAVPH